MRNYRLGMRALSTIAAAVFTAAALAACDTASDPIAAPDAAAAPRPSASKNWWSVKPAASMSISPTSAQIGVGGTVTLHVTYLDQRGNEIAIDPYRLTWYGCTVLVSDFQIADASLQLCENVASLQPIYPGLRDVVVTGLAPGLLDVVAEDGFGHRVTSRVRVQ